MQTMAYDTAYVYMGSNSRSPPLNTRASQFCLSLETNLKHLYNQDSPAMVAAVLAGTFYTNFHQAMMAELGNCRNDGESTAFVALVYNCLNTLIHSAIAKICDAYDCSQNAQLLQNDLVFLHKGVARMAQAVMPLYLYQPCACAIKQDFHSCLVTQTTSNICESAVAVCERELSKK